MEVANGILTPSQLRMLQIIFAKGAEDASRTLSKWLRSGVRLSVDAVEQVPLRVATGMLGPDDSMVIACAMGLTGKLRGTLVVAFEQESGLALADILMGRPLGTSRQWGELERSAALETTNIVGCAYLNSLSSHLPDSCGPGEMIPSPPELHQDFAASLLETLLMEQALVSDQVLVIRSQFTRDQTQLCWHLMLVPDLESLGQVVGALSEIHSRMESR